MSALERLVKCGDCKGGLFVSWGLEVIVRPAQWDVTRLGQKATDTGKMDVMMVHVCAACKTLYVFDDNVLVKLDELVGTEDVQAILETLRSSPMAGKAKNIDP